VHDYCDTALDIQETLKTRLRTLTPQQFEQVLHPVFQEDEFTLVMVGAVLGLIVGYGQLVWDKRDRAAAAAAAKDNVTIREPLHTALRRSRP